MPRKPAATKKPAVTKIFVLDTNVLMHDPSCLFRFEEHDIFLPIMTLEELDNNKKGMSEIARNARQASRMLDEMLAHDGVDIDEDVAAFQFRGGRDLTGYEDGTENPQGDRAREVAIAKDGSSFVAGQRWVHDLGRFAAMTESARDNTIGRSLETNEELASAPASAHVKRTAQESFEPDAFMLRRSMPWGSTAEHGLYFVAFGATLDPYERVLRRMAGLDDGIVDALLGFTRPVSGGYYWCPPVAGGRLDLEALGSD